VIDPALLTAVVTTAGSVASAFTMWWRHRSHLRDREDRPGHDVGRRDDRCLGEARGSGVTGAVPPSTGQPPLILIMDLATCAHAGGPTAVCAGPRTLIIRTCGEMKHSHAD
jgi:hypothetical protein